MLKQFDISGKNIIVTGAARGIGKGIIRVLADSGANILCTALTDVYLKKLSEELSLKNTNIEVLATDNTTISGWDKTIDLALQKWGHIDVLINNLGDAISKPVANLSDDESSMTIIEWNKIIDINLNHAFLG